MNKIDTNNDVKLVGRFSLYLAVLGFILSWIIAPYVTIRIYEKNSPLETKIIKLETIQAQHCEELKKKIDKSEFKMLETTLNQHTESVEKINVLIQKIQNQLTRLNTLVEIFEKKIAQRNKSPGH